MCFSAVVNQNKGFCFVLFFFLWMALREEATMWHFGQKSGNDDIFSMPTVDGLNQIFGSCAIGDSRLQIPILRIQDISVDV